ncbi:hypothetical protein BH11ARM2_BH11ARM2_13170 [soil metagenome]
MLKYDNLKGLDDDHVMRTYVRMPALFVQGAGCTLWDNRGNEYLDLLAGIGVCSLGHCHPAIVAAVTRQAQQLIHVSNLLLSAPQAQLASKLCELSGMEKTFYAVCGATANETALKIAKKHGHQRCPDGDYELITLWKSFHGRTLGVISATGQPKYQEPFLPLVPGFRHIHANNLEELRAAFSDKTAAILMEPIMGEGGVQELSAEFMQEAERLCREHDAFLMVDEVQCGMGRTGTWFAFQSVGVQPDVLCLAKGLGGGVPIGACLARGKAAEMLVPGDHGATFGGNPLTCAAALAVVDTIEHTGVLEHVQKVGAYFQDALRKMPRVTTVKGKGLMIGATLDAPMARDVVKTMFEKGVIANATDEYNLRFVPPLIITEAQISHALGVLADSLGVPAPTPAIFERAASVIQRTYGDVLSIDDLGDAQLVDILQLAETDKRRRRHAPAPISSVEGRSVAMVFEKPSLRTRVSFETAIRELGGHPIHLTKADIGMGSREALVDVAGNLSRWVSLIVARLYWQRDLQTMADVATVPVVNALTEWEHPCQALADLLTVREEFDSEPVKIAYVGDGNNVARSLAKLGLRLGHPVTLIGPKNFQMEEIPGLVQTENPEEGLVDAKVVYTDVWVSMGDEREQEQRLKTFQPYQVNERLMSIADKDAIFLHCLPARRGLEVTDDVIDGRQSRVHDQAENRLHAQKALLRRLLEV